MKTKRFFATCMMAVLLSASIFAQNQNQNDKTHKQQRLTPEEMVNKHTESMQQRLLLDDATAQKFAPIYKEYLTALQKCRACGEQKKELTDAERIARIENGFATQKQIIETKEACYKKLKKVLNARQLETVFSPQKHQALKKNGKRPNAPMPLREGHGPQAHPQAPQGK